ncbi:MAG TPA: integrase arm-type DNA-binding domain-containing protein [Rhizomicrobium sp.]|nr:integrase arm-type DNA-binding domain-containing protein [Rhizomicrobium sp.]
MGHASEKLKALSIERYSRKVGLYSDGRGLCLRVSSPTARSWVFRYMLLGKAREMGLGPYPDISLAEARVIAAEARKLKAQGKDPIAAREAVRAQERAEAARSKTFRDCAEAYIAARKNGWKNAKHAAQWSATLETYAMPLIGSLSVQSVDGAMVHKVLEPIWSKKPETAGRLRGRIEAVLDWATACHYRQGENPARWKGHIENMFPSRSKVRKVQHHAALPYSEIGAFMSALEAQEGLGALALRFAILTAARTGEVIEAKWSEIDFSKEVWTVPGDRMKGDREHRVPLTKAVLDILRQRRKAADGSEFVFPGAKPGKALSNMAMLETLRRMGRDDITVHGFRSSFKDWAAECTSYPGEVSEAALAHAVGDKVEAAYRRGDLFEKRRKLMNAWATYCANVARDSKVVPIGRSART